MTVPLTSTALKTYVEIGATGKTRDGRCKNGDGGLEPWLVKTLRGLKVGGRTWVIGFCNGFHLLAPGGGRLSPKIAYKKSGLNNGTKNLF